MILDSRGKPLLGQLSSGLGLVGYLSREGSSFSGEIAHAITIVETYCSRKKIPISDIGFTGELDFLVKEFGLIKSSWTSEYGAEYFLLWFNPVLSSGLSEAVLRKLEEITMTQDTNAGVGLEVFSGKTSQQVIDTIANDCRSRIDTFSHFEPEMLLQAMSSARNVLEETQTFVTTTQVDMLQLDDEDDRIFRRYCYSFSWKSKVTLSDEEMDVIADIARRTAEDCGSLTVTNYLFESIHGNFSIISHRTIIVAENYDELEFYGPYCIRDGNYPGLPTERVIEVL